MATGYLNTFILIAPDCPVDIGTVPPRPASIAGLEHALLTAAPYQLTGEDLILAVHLRHKQVDDGEDREAFRVALFSKPHPCLRASMLPKRYGWGAHYDCNGRIALYGRETEAYRILASRDDLAVLPAMRNQRRSVKG